MIGPAPVSYRGTNWSSDTALQRKRGSLLIWLDKELIWLASHDGQARSPGR